MLFQCSCGVHHSGSSCRSAGLSQGLVAHCSPAYWSLSATIAVVLICVSMLGARRASIRNTSTHLLATPASGQLVYDAKTVVRIVVGSMGAGMLAAVCGIGGGIVMAPLLLHQGVLPQVQMASMGLTLFVMSSTTALFYIVQGMVLPDYSLFLAGATAVGAVVGRKVVVATGVTERPRDAQPGTHLTVHTLGCSSSGTRAAQILVTRSDVCQNGADTG